MKNQSWKPAQSIIALFMITLLSSCTHVFSKNSIKEINVQTVAESNNNMSTRVDIVFVYEQAAEKKLPTTSSQWFSDKRAIHASLKSSIDVISLELSPGHIGQQITLPQRYRSALHVISYSNTQRESQPADLSEFSCVIIIVEKVTTRYEHCY